MAKSAILQRVFIDVPKIKCAIVAKGVLEKMKKKALHVNVKKASGAFAFKPI